MESKESKFWCWLGLFYVLVGGFMERNGGGKWSGDRIIYFGECAKLPRQDNQGEMEYDRSS